MTVCCSEYRLIIMLLLPVISVAILDSLIRKWYNVTGPHKGTPHEISYMNTNSALMAAK